MQNGMVGMSKRDQQRCILYICYFINPFPKSQQTNTSIVHLVYSHISTFYLHIDSCKHVNFPLNQCEGNWISMKSMGGETGVKLSVYGNPEI